MSNVNLLIIEDSEADIFLLKRALKKSLLNFNTTEITDGERALQKVLNLRDVNQSDWPNIILLDINLPKVDGYEILKELKLDDKMSCIPVLIYSSSEVDENLLKAHKISLKYSIKKPRSLKEASLIIKKIEDIAEYGPLTKP